MPNHSEIINQLVELITKGNAHTTFENAIEGLKFDDIHKKVPKIPYNIWMLAEHMKIVQHDLLTFSTGIHYHELQWPDDYWPDSEAQPGEQQWQTTLEQIKNEQEQFIQLLQKGDVDLYTPFKHGTGQNLLREALLLADHNSYHTGQIVLIRRLLGEWES